MTVFRLGCTAVNATLMKMLDWWLNLEPEGMQTFVTIGIASSTVLFLQMIFILMGGAFDIPDFDLDVGEGGATGMFSIRGIGAFFTGFGWTGAAMLDGGNSLLMSVLTATLVGVAVLVGFVGLMHWLYSLRSEGTMDYNNAINQIGSVYVPIPPRRQGLGQIEVLVQGRTTTVRALSDNEERIENRTAVKVVELVDERTLLVETLDPAPREDAPEETTDPKPEDDDLTS